MRKASLKQILQATSRHFCWRMVKEGGKKNKNVPAGVPVWFTSWVRGGQHLTDATWEHKATPHQTTPEG